MKLIIVTCFLAVTLVLLPSQLGGLLTENGTCTNGKIIIGNETKILNQSAYSFFKNLTLDNRLMAEVLCQAMLNETIRKWNFY